MISKESVSSGTRQFYECGTQRRDESVLYVIAVQLGSHLMKAATAYRHMRLALAANATHESNLQSKERAP